MDPSARFFLRRRIYLQHSKISETTESIKYVKRQQKKNATNFTIIEHPKLNEVYLRRWFNRLSVEWNNTFEAALGTV